MQSNSQEHDRIDGILDKMLIVNIDNNLKFVDSSYTVIDYLHKYVGINQVFQDSFLKNLNANYIVFHDMGNIEYLENFILNSIERKICNNQGLYIFCTEQVLHTATTKKRFNLDGVEDIPNIQVDWQHDVNDTVWSPELESINTFVKNNNLKNVTVFISAVDKFGYYKNKYNFKLERWDPYVNAVASILENFKTDVKQNSNIETHFWCGNWGYRPHRHLVTAFASTLDTKYSWGYTDKNYNLLSHLWFDYNKFKYKNQILKGLLRLKPSSLDLNTGEQEIKGSISDVVLRPKTAPAGPDLLEYSSRELFGNTFVSIINSSTFGEPFPVYDEKPLNAIFNYKPFVMVGPPGSLALMRQDGFLTFGEFWNEDYDDCTNHQKRLEKIFDVLLEIQSWNIEKCQNIYKQMNDILEHNYNNINRNLQRTNEMRSTI